MANLGEIAEEPRTAEGGNLGQENDRDFVQQNTKRKRSRRRRGSGGSQGSAHLFSSDDTARESLEDNESGRPRIRQPVVAKKQGTLPPQEDHKARFYEDYRKVAEEYDKEFIKRYDEDLDTTLIFAGLFSAVASAFIIQVDSQLKPDSGDETAALLRVLIYKIDNTTFGNDVPALPQWTGSPPAMVHVQAILFTSLTTSLISAFLAMLGKQWLNRYASTDLRGSAIERSQNRQRKLDGIVTWYFDWVLESLPVMLQVALLLLGSALSRYLWEVNITIASVVTGITSFGLLSYLFILAVGTVWESCPYQTPGSRYLRYLGLEVPRIVHSASSAVGNIFKASRAVRNTRIVWSDINWSSWRDVMTFSTFIILAVPRLFVIDVYHLGRAVVMLLYHLFRMVYTRLRSSPSRSFDDQMAALDLRCIFWTLQTSLDQLVRASALKHLITITEFPDSDPEFVTDRFNLFIGYISTSNDKVVVIQGLEELAALSAGCLFQTFRYLSATRPTSSTLADLRRRYHRVFPRRTDFRGLPFYHTMTRIRALANPGTPNRDLCERWTDYQPSNPELALFARNMVKVAQEEYQQTQTRKLPRWILRFALYFLSLNPLSPPSVIANCLTIIAIALDIDPSSVLILDESVRVEQLSNLIIQNLEMMAEGPGTDPFRAKRKEISALFPYAACLAQDGPRGIFDAILRVASRSASGGFMWRHIRPCIASWFDESSPPPSNEAIIFATPSADWGWGPVAENAVARWGAAVLATSHSDEVGRSVVDALLQIACVDSLRPRIPIEIWAWLKKLPPLPPVCRGRNYATRSDFVHHIRGLGDIEILRSYFLLVWSEWEALPYVGSMEVAIRGEFCGIAMWWHRKDLTERLDRVLEQLDRGLEYFNQHKPAITEAYIAHVKGHYEQLKEALAELDREAMETLSQSHLTVVCALPLPCP